MKRRIGFFCLALALLLSGCGGTAVTVPDNPPLPAAAGLRVAVATDLHLDPDHTDKSGTPAAAAYNLELVDALLWDARQQGAEILLLTGDLVNGGKVHRHEALEAMPGCAPFFRCAEGYAYGWWLKDLMENASPKFSGFTLG